RDHQLPDLVNLEVWSILTCLPLPEHRMTSPNSPSVRKFFWTVMSLLFVTALGTIALHFALQKK
ncbi:hypothetical protein K2P96_00765, partial [Patescibacteria group bacterium]|nr:hypothetical protein [Patescibacteria group bacterium]